MRRPTGICKARKLVGFLVTCDDGTVWQFCPQNHREWYLIGKVPQSDETETPKKVRVTDWSPSA